MKNTVQQSVFNYLYDKGLLDDFCQYLSRDDREMFIEEARDHFDDNTILDGVDI